METPDLNPYSEPNDEPTDSMGTGERPRPADGAPGGFVTGNAAGGHAQGGNAGPEDEFSATFGEPLAHVLDVSTWRPGTDLAQLYRRLQQAVAEGVEQDRRTRGAIREQILTKLKDRNDPFAPEAAGFYQMTAEQVAEVHRSLLFNGGTECCDGTIQVHDSLLLSAVQIGLALVSYQGSQGTWVQRLYQRDLRARLPDPFEEALELLSRSSRRDPDPEDGDEEDGRDVSQLARRGLMEYAERAALLRLSKSPWRMGHGNPVPFSLLVPSFPEMARGSVDTLRQLIFDHKRFVFVDSRPKSLLLRRLGNALNPLEFALVETLAVRFSEERRFRVEQAGAGYGDAVRLILDFIEEVGPTVVTGVYRAGEHSPPQVFFAHRDYVFQAAALAIADSVLQPHRGFPLLIDLADRTCQASFDSGSFRGSIQDAYAAAGEPARYLGERETRGRPGW